MSGGGARHWEQDREATVYVGNLDERVTDALVWELMLQAGRIQNIHLPKDRVTQTHQGFGFVEFLSEEDAEYAAKVMNQASALGSKDLYIVDTEQVRLYGKPIRVNKASADKQKTVEVGAELFIGNLDPMVDEKTLYDTFGRFGSLVSAPKVARDEANLSKGYGFISFADFEASDAAIANMNGQYLMNKEVSVQYAYKKDGKGERHGDEAERMLAAQARKHNVQPAIQPLPPQLFQAAPAAAPPPMPNGNYGIPNGNYQQQPPPRPQSNTPLPPPPSGLPARPPPSQGGYGGPPSMMPQGFGGPPPPSPMGGFHPAGFPQPGFPPAGFPQPGAPPPFAPPPGFGPPPGFQQQQQQGYGRR